MKDLRPDPANESQRGKSQYCSVVQAIPLTDAGSSQRGNEPPRRFPSESATFATSLKIWGGLSARPFALRACSTMRAVGGLVLASATPFTVRIIVRHTMLIRDTPRPEPSKVQVSRSHHNGFAQCILSVP